jgi:sporadic carbohydrate cluster 2OG-Fe(II) oxygenase
VATESIELREIALSRMEADKTVSFLSPLEIELSRTFLRDGYVIREAESESILESIRQDVIQITTNWLKQYNFESASFDLANSHKFVSNDRLNDLRLHIFAEINKFFDIRQRYFSLARETISTLVGNELAMQNKVNMSVQQPNDESSVLPMHSDIWTGDSPFQVVLWVPLTDASDTNSMFFLPPIASREARSRVASGEFRSMDQIENAYRSQLVTMVVPYGKVLIFDSGCLHGNVLNETKTARWSINCRFTGLLTPFTNPERRLGTYYLPITTRAATKIGLEALTSERA